LLKPLTGARRNRALVGTNLAGTLFCLEPPGGRNRTRDDGEISFACNAFGGDLRSVSPPGFAAGAATQGRVMARNQAALGIF
jgi:hypothetical protein